MKCNVYINIILAVILGLLITTGITLAGESYSKGVTDELSNNFIRFHLIANSDTVEDQQMKEYIRDMVLAYMSPLLENSKSIEETRDIIRANMSDIEDIALDVIREWGKEYDVNILLDKTDFPTKRYGDIALPAGEYEACRIIIGDGKGKNWWCVMFPPLCYVDITSGIVPSNEKDRLRDTMSEEEYNLITKSTSGSKEDIPIRFKFKIIEIFNEKQMKLARTLE